MNFSFRIRILRASQCQVPDIPMQAISKNQDPVDVSISSCSPVYIVRVVYEAIILCSLCLHLYLPSLFVGFHSELRLAQASCYHSLARTRTHGARTTHGACLVRRVVCVGRLARGVLGSCSGLSCRAKYTYFILTTMC